jgi:dTDP-4-dehydrorhamnose reductase
MRILICGVSGMIGHTLWRAVAGRHEDVFGTLHGRRDVFARRLLFDERVIEQFEAADFESVSAVLDRLRPAVIVNCIGITKRKAEVNDVAKMFTVNARFPHQLARWAARNRARVIHFSTDCVFDGTEGNYSERSVVTAPDLYGQTKYFGELDYDHCLTIRTSMIGREITGYTELLEWFLGQGGKRITGYRNARYSGLTTLAMAGVVQRIIWDHPQLCGKYQIAGPVITKYDLLLQLREAFKLEVEIMPDETFRCDRTLQSQKFIAATGITVPGWKEMIAALADDRELYDRLRAPSKGEGIGALAKPGVS